MLGYCKIGILLTAVLAVLSACGDKKAVDSSLIQAVFSREFTEPVNQKTLAIVVRSLVDASSTQHEIVGWLETAHDETIEKALGGAVAVDFKESGIPPLMLRYQAKNATYSLAPDGSPTEFLNASLVFRQGSIEAISGKKVSLLTESGTQLTTDASFPALMALTGSHLAGQLTIRRCSAYMQDLPWAPWNAGKQVQLQVGDKIDKPALDIGYYRFIESDFQQLFSESDRHGVDTTFGQLQTDFLPVLISRTQIGTINLDTVQISLVLETQLGIEIRFIYENCGTAM